MSDHDSLPSFLPASYYNSFEDGERQQQHHEEQEVNISLKKFIILRNSFYVIYMFTCLIEPSVVLSYIDHSADFYLHFSIFLYTFVKFFCISITGLVGLKDYRTLNADGYKKQKPFIYVSIGLVINCISAGTIITVFFLTPGDMITPLVIIPFSMLNSIYLFGMTRLYLSESDEIISLMMIKDKPLEYN